MRSSRRSASVDFPWSMWAMMEKLRMRVGSRIGRMYGSRDPFASATGRLTTARAGCHHRARDATCRKCGGRDGAAGARCVDPTAARRLRGALVDLASSVATMASSSPSSAAGYWTTTATSRPSRRACSSGWALGRSSCLASSRARNARTCARLDSLRREAPVPRPPAHEPVRQAEDCVPSGRRRRAGVPAAGQLRPLSFVGLRPALRRRRVLRAPARAASSTSDQRASRSTDRPGQPGARTRPRLAVSATA